MLGQNPREFGDEFFNGVLTNADSSRCVFQQLKPVAKLCRSRNLI